MVVLLALVSLALSVPVSGSAVEVLSPGVQVTRSSVRSNVRRMIAMVLAGARLWYEVDDAGRRAGQRPRVR